MYDNNVTYPSKNDYITCKVFDKNGKLIKEDISFTDVIIQGLLKDNQIVKCLNDVSYHKQMNDYYNEQNKIDNQFKQDMFKELDIENNEKRDLLFSKAWEMGHSSGYDEVKNYMIDLVDLIL